MNYIKDIIVRVTNIVVMPLLALLKTVVYLAVWVVVIDLIIGWLIKAGILNMNNRFVYPAAEFFRNIADVMLNPIRSVIPLAGTVDLSPLVLLLLLGFIGNVIGRILIRGV